MIVDHRKMPSGQYISGSELLIFLTSNSILVFTVGYIFNAAFSDEIRNISTRYLLSVRRVEEYLSIPESSIAYSTISYFIVSFPIMFLVSLIFSYRVVKNYIRIVELGNLVGRTEVLASLRYSIFPIFTLIIYAFTPLLGADGEVYRFGIFFTFPYLPIMASVVSCFLVSVMIQFMGWIMLRGVQRDG